MTPRRTSSGRTERVAGTGLGLGGLRRGLSRSRPPARSHSRQRDTAGFGTAAPHPVTRRGPHRKDSKGDAQRGASTPDNNAVRPSTSLPPPSPWEAAAAATAGPLAPFLEGGVEADMANVRHHAGGGVVYCLLICPLLPSLAGGPTSFAATTMAGPDRQPNWSTAAAAGCKAASPTARVVQAAPPIPTPMVVPLPPPPDPILLLARRLAVVRVSPGSVSEGIRSLFLTLEPCPTSLKGLPSMTFQVQRASGCKKPTGCHCGRMQRYCPWPYALAQCRSNANPSS